MNSSKPNATSTPSSQASPGWLSDVVALRGVVPAVLIVLVTALAYTSSFKGVFIRDDIEGIKENHHIRQLWPLSEAISLAQWGKGTTLDGRPLISFSLAVNYALTGNEPWGFHLGNLLIHVGAAWLIFALVRRTLERSAPEKPGLARGVALGAALAFAVHPMTTSAVTYMVQRAETLTALLLLLTLYCTMRSLQSGPGRSVKLWSLAAIASCAIGMTAKETMLVAPLIIVLYDYCFSRDSVTGLLRRRGWLYAGLAATVPIRAIIMWVTRDWIMQGYQVYNTKEYVMTEPGVILHYLRLAIWPLDVVLEPHFEPATLLVTILCGGMILILLGASIWGIVRRRAWGFLGGAFFLALAPSSSFYPTGQFAFTHRTYLAMAFVVTLLVGCAAWALNRLGPRRIVQAAKVSLLVCLVAILGALTFQRNALFHDELRLWLDHLAWEPLSPEAHWLAGNVYEQRQEHEKAVFHLQRTVDLRPINVDARLFLGQALAKSGRTAEAIENFKIVIQRSAVLNSQGYVAWGNALRIQKPPRPHAADEAIDLYHKALDASPDNAWALFILSDALVEQGRAKEGLLYYKQGMKIKPDEDRISSPAIRIGLGMAFLGEGDHRGAKRQFAMAVQLAPNDFAAVNNLVWLLATSRDDAVRDGRMAVTMMERVCRLTKNGLAQYLDTMAAAYAEVGWFEDAVKTAQIGIEQAKKSDPLMAAEISKRLDLYRVKKPYRE